MGGDALNAVQQALIYLTRTNGQVTSQIIKDLISDHAPRAAKMKALYKRYKADQDGVPIFQRSFEDPNKINNKLNNDFFSDIVDTKVGYFAGEPIAYNLDKTSYSGENGELNETDYRAHSSIIDRFRTVNNIDDLDAETAKMAAICGTAARLCYIDSEGMERICNIPPWEAIFIGDRSTGEVQYALRYYPITINGESTTRVEWYDRKMVYFYVQQGDEFIPDDTEQPKEHIFDFVPLIEFPNNEERLGDAEKVLSLIDGYDRTLSDVNSEIEQFRLSYMVFYGVEITPEVIEAAKRTGAFGLPNYDGNERAEFLTKQMNDTIIENHLNRLEENIMRFSKSVNFSDENFAGQASGVALKFKMLGLESKCIVAERKMTAALRQMFKVICSAWAKKGITIDYTNIWFQFKRNFPLDILSEAQSTAMLRGHVSEQTRLSLLSFVDDPEYELELMRKEAEEAYTVNLDAYLEDEDDEPGKEV